MKVKESTPPARNRASPAKRAGPRVFFSRSYSAGERNAQSCQSSTGEASTSPTMKPSLRTIISGSVGESTTSFPAGMYGAIGRFRMSRSRNRSVSQSPSAKHPMTARRLRRMRTRSSSRCSRNGISPAARAMADLCPASGAEVSEVGAGEVGFGGGGVLLEEPFVVRLGGRGVLPVFLQATHLVQRRGGLRRLGEATDDLDVVGECRVGRGEVEGFRHRVECVGNQLVVRIDRKSGG